MKCSTWRPFRATLLDGTGGIRPKAEPLQMKHVRAAVGLAIVAASSPYVCQAQSPQRYNIQPDSVSVSGISSGADIAHQLHVAYSSKIHGVGLLAGGCPVLC